MSNQHQNFSTDAALECVTFSQRIDDETQYMTVGVANVLDDNEQLCVELVTNGWAFTTDELRRLADFIDEQMLGREVPGAADVGKTGKSPAEGTAEWLRQKMADAGINAIPLGTVEFRDTAHNSAAPDQDKGDHAEGVWNSIIAKSMRGPISLDALILLKSCKYDGFITSRNTVKLTTSLDLSSRIEAAAEIRDEFRKYEPGCCVMFDYRPSQKH